MSQPTWIETILKAIRGDKPFASMLDGVAARYVPCDIAIEAKASRIVDVTNRMHERSGGFSSEKGHLVPDPYRDCQKRNEGSCLRMPEAGMGAYFDSTVIASLTEPRRSAPFAAARVSRVRAEQDQPVALVSRIAISARSVFEGPVPSRQRNRNRVFDGASAYFMWISMFSSPCMVPDVRRISGFLRMEKSTRQTPTPKSGGSDPEVLA